MSTRFSDIFVNGDNSEEFYINGAQIKEAWLNGECIWALGADIKTLFWLGIHNGIWYLLFEGNDNHYHVGMAEQLGNIDNDIILPSAISENSRMLFSEDCLIILLNRNTPSVINNLFVDYDLTEVKQTSQLNISDAVSFNKACVFGHYVAAMGYSTTERKGYISIHDLSTNKNAGIIYNSIENATLCTDGTYLYYPRRQLSAESWNNGFWINRLDPETLEEEAIHINISGHDEFYKQVVADRMGTMPSSIDYVLAQQDTWYLRLACVGGKIIVDCRVSIRAGNLYPDATIRYYINSSFYTVSALEDAHDTRLANELCDSYSRTVPILEDNNIQSIYFDGNKVNDYDFLADYMPSYDDEYAYLHYRLQNKIAKIKVSTEIIPVEY